jgi:integrase
MANIEKRKSNDGDSAYRVKVRIKGFPAQSATFERLTDAKRWAQQTESAIREGRHFKSSEAKRHTLKDTIERYLREVMPTKPKSAKSQTRQLEWWRERLGSYALSEISPSLLAEYREKLASGMLKDGSMTVEVSRAGSDQTERKPVERRSPSTVVRYLAALSHVLTVAMKEWGWLDDSPMRKVSKPKEPRGRVRFLSDPEREALLAACQSSKSPDLYLAVVLALSTGARQMEIMGLRWKQVDLDRRAITLYETKNGEIRALPLVSKAHDMMRERSKVRRLDTDLVFPARRKPKTLPNGKQAELKPVDLRQPFEFALKQAGILDFRWHDLRHSCASYLAMNGASLAEIAEVLGHKTLQMVRRYAHLSQAHTAKVVERMNQKIFG